MKQVYRKWTEFLSLEQMPQFLREPKLTCVEINWKEEEERRRKMGGDLPNYYKAYINNRHTLK
jgi:hypothetical protein